MPTNLLYDSTSFVSEPPILASTEGLRRVQPAVTIDPQYITPDGQGFQIVRPGSLVYKRPDGTPRVNARATLEAAITSGVSTQVQLGVFPVHPHEMCQFFVPGDALKVVRPYGFITLAQTWAEADTLAVTVGGQTATFAAGSATLATAATNFATAINGEPRLSRLVEAIAAGAIVYLFSRSLASYGLAVVATTAGTGTATANAANLQGEVTIGTIDTAGVNVAAGTITLNATAAISLPVGAPVGITATPYALLIGPFNVGEGEGDLSGIVGGYVWGDRLPYWDQDIAQAMPEIRFA